MRRRLGRRSGRRAGVRSCSPCRSRSAARWAADNDDDGVWPAWLVLGAVVGFVLGAGCAAWVQRVGHAAHARHRRPPPAPTSSPRPCSSSSGWSAALDVHWFGVVFNLTVVTFAGLLGGLLGQRLRARGVLPGSRRPPMTAILVIDVGTTSVRAAVVDEQPADRRPSPTGRLRRRRRRPDSSSSTPPRCPTSSLDACQRGARGRRPSRSPRWASRTSGRAPSCGTGPPASRSRPASAGRTCAPSMECIMAKAEHGLALAPNQSATKWRGCSTNVEGAAERDLCFGTVDTWLAWTLTGGQLHVTDHTNAAVTGLAGRRRLGAGTTHALDVLGIPAAVLPTVVDSCGVVGAATALPGAPPIAALVGDQQASLVGQGCVAPGRAKITFGTGGMLDVCRGDDAPASARRGRARHVPDRRLVARRPADVGRRGDHAVRRHERRVASRRPRRCSRRAPRATTSRRRWRRADGAVFVPALLGLGTPRGTTAPAARCSASPGARRGPPRAGRPRGRRPARRRPGRGGRRRHRADRSTRSASTAG